MADADQYLTPEAKARVRIDAMLEAAGFAIQNRNELNLYAAQGVAVREFLLVGNLEVDYLLFVDGQAVGSLEAKKVGSTLSGVEPQSVTYAKSLPGHVNAPHDPLPFRYESTGEETTFTNGLDPEPRSRYLFAVHRPETLARWIAEAQDNPDAPTLRGRLHHLPEIDRTGLWDAQHRAIVALEKSLAFDRARAVIQTVRTDPNTGRPVRRHHPDQPTRTRPMRFARQADSTPGGSVPAQPTPPPSAP